MAAGLQLAEKIYGVNFLDGTADDRFKQIPQVAHKASGLLSVAVTKLTLLTG